MQFTEAVARHLTSTEGHAEVYPLRHIMVAMPEMDHRTLGPRAAGFRLASSNTLPMAMVSSLRDLADADTCKTSALHGRLSKDAILEYHIICKLCQDLRYSQRHAFLVAQRHADSKIATFLQMLEQLQVARAKR